MSIRRVLVVVFMLGFSLGWVFARMVGILDQTLAAVSR